VAFAFSAFGPACDAITPKPVCRTAK
jgi:hypothetical protein